MNEHKASYGLEAGFWVVLTVFLHIWQVSPGDTAPDSDVGKEKY